MRGVQRATESMARLRRPNSRQFKLWQARAVAIYKARRAVPPPDPPMSMADKIAASWKEQEKFVKHTQHRILRNQHHHSARRGPSGTTKIRTLKQTDHSCKRRCITSVRYNTYPQTWTPTGSRRWHHRLNAPAMVSGVSQSRHRNPNSKRPGRCQ